MFRIKSFVLVLVLFSFSGCGDDGTESGGGGGSGSNPSRPTNPIDNTEVGEIESSGFWVNVLTQNQFPVYISSENGFGTPCLIESDTTTNEVLNEHARQIVRV